VAKRSTGKHTNWQKHQLAKTLTSKNINIDILGQN
jgi:hypothetical protein